MHTVEIDENPIVERVDLRKATQLVINGGIYRPYSGQKNEYQQQAQTYLREHGFPHIKVLVNDEIRRGGVIVGPIFYRIGWKDGDFSMAFGSITCKLFKQRIEPIMNWAHANCEVEPVLDQRGLHFFSDSDFLLYKVAFAGREL